MTDDRVRLALLVAVLVSLVAYALAARTGPFGIGDGSVTGQAASSCPPGGAPALAPVGLTRLLGLRAGLERMMTSVDADLRPYEEGLVQATSAWTDAEPASGASVVDSDRWPAGYEMRWWVKDGDDVVADVFVFADPRRAHDFSTLALGPKCRSARTVSAAPAPRGADNLEWRNPLGLTQEDVYVRRGPRVYRVSVVKPGADEPTNGSTRRAAFALVDGLACGLTSCR